MLPSEFAHLRNKKQTTTTTTTPNQVQVPDIAKQHVVIIGAGMAGLSAAFSLKKHANVTVLEAKNYIGGRTHMDAACKLDFGASWIHDADSSNKVFQLAKKLGVPYIWCDYDHTVYYDVDGSKCTDIKPEQVADKWIQILEQASKQFRAKKKKQDYASSLHDMLMPLIKAKKLSDHMERALVMTMYQETSIDMALYPKNLSIFNADDDYDESSSSDDEDEKDNPKGLADVFLTHGWGKIIDYLAKDVKIVCNKPVQAIQYKLQKEQKTGTPNVTIIAADGETITCDYVIVAVPLGVLQSKAIQFTPALPESKLKALPQLQMGNLCKIILEFPTAFWDTSVEAIQWLAPKGVFPEEGKMVHWYFNYTKRPVLMAFIGDSLARFAESCDNVQQITEMAMHPLRVMYKNAAVEPTSVWVSPWSIDPFTQGSYSAIPLHGHEDAYEELAKSIANCVFFAGEHTDDENWATVHGAYYTGEREASRIINLIHKKKK